MNSYKLCVSKFFKPILVILFLLNLSYTSFSQSGVCDPSTPFFNVDLTGLPNGTWTSPSVPRVGNCCGTQSPDKCIEFSITLDPSAVAINFQIVSGAIPSGAMYYQVGCGPAVVVGSPLCLNGPGPYTLTFCKPGNNINTYAITSIAGPTVSPDDTIGNGCSTTMYASGLLVNSSINWTSIYPGAVGAYNSYLSCTSDCDSSVVTGTATAPPYVDYVVCGMPLAGGCVPPGLFCDTIRITFSPPIINPVNPNPAILCANANGILLTGTVGGGVPPYTYAWTNGANGAGTVVGTSLTYTANSAGTYSFIVYDQNYPDCPAQITNVPVTISPLPVINAGPDQTICGTSATLNGTVTGATGGMWSGGSGVFFPSATSANATYTPTATELSFGTVILTFTSTGNGACSAVSDQVIIHISPPISASITAPAILCYGTTATLTANVTGGIAPYFYLWNTGQNTQTLTNMPPGTYSVSITGSGGSNCIATATVTIASNSQIVVSTSPGSTVSCNNTAVISASATGGTGTLNYLWSNGAATNSTIVYTGTYVITVTDAVGCTATNSVSVIANNSTLTAIVNQPSILCNGATATLTVVPNGGFGGYSYSWNTGAVSNSIVVGAGNYCATVTDGGGCTTVACASITQSSPLNVNIPTPTAVCNGSPATVTAFANGGQAPYTFLWSNGQATPSITVFSGNYSVTVTDAIGCIASGSVNIAQATPLNLAVTSIMVGCSGGNNGTANVNVTGGTPAYFYSWAPYGGSSATAFNLIAGTFTVTVTDAIGCSQSSSITVTQPTPLNASVSVNNNVSCYNGNDGSATVIQTGGTPGYSYAWNPIGGTGQSATNLSAGNFIVTVTDVKGCAQTVSGFLTQPAQLMGSIVSKTNVSCNGGNNGSATVSPFGGTFGYTYLWSPSGGTNATGANLSAGSYTVTITDSKGCIAQVTTVITQPAALSATITGSTTVSCNGGNNGTATVSATGGTGPYTYAWNSNPIQTGITATNLSAGNYSVTVTDAKGCVATSNAVAITQPQVLTASASPSSSISCNGTIIISSSANGGSGSYNYQWSNGATTPSITVNTGTYTIIVTDGNGCTATNSVSIVASNSTLGVSVPTPATICFGTVTTLIATASGGFGSYTYQWNTGAITPSIIAGAGNYCVTVTDDGGCIAIACVTVSQNTPVSVSVGTPPNVCPGASTTISAVGSGGQPPYSFLWNTGETTASVLKPVGTYTVTISDNTGSSCSATTTATINQETSINLVASSTNVSCFGGSNGTALVNANGGMPGYTYSWAPSGGTTASATNLIPGTYTVTVTDFIGCVKTANVAITQPSTAISINMSSTPVLCYGQSNGSATATGSGGSAPYSYFWPDANGSGATTINSLSAGIYTAFVADATGCYMSDSVEVITANDFLLSGNTTATTCGSNTAVTVSGGSGTYSYFWAPSGGNAANAANLLPGTYTVTVTNSNGCQKQLGLTVPVIPSPVTANFSAATACSNTITSFTDLSGSTNGSIIGWSWDFGEPLSGTNNFSTLQNPFHTYSSAGTFSITLTVTTSVGCTGTFTGSVLVYPAPLADFTAAPTCVSSFTTFTDESSISSGYITSWSWNFGDPASGSNNSSILINPTHSFANQGSYQIVLTITSNNGCTGSVTKNQVISGAPIAAFTATNVCENLATPFTDASSVTGSTINSWAWNFGDGSPINTSQNPTHTYSSIGIYYVILTVNSASGCQNSITVPVTVYSSPVPNFSAAGVCINDVTNFSNQTTISSGSITSYEWNLGNFSSLYYGQNLNYVYATSGVFNVTLTATSSSGCVASVTLPVDVYPMPVANFTSSGACLNSPTFFTDNSTVPNGSIASWIWAFGDGSPVGTVQNPSHIYLNTLGTLNVSLVVTSTNGCLDTVTKPVNIFPLPVAQFTVSDSSGCATYCTEFTDFSSTQNGILTNWIWDFGDQSSQSSMQNSNHCYNQSGQYTIKLTVTSSNGCSAVDSVINLITVYPVPEAEFTFTPNDASTLNSQVNFTDQSVGASAWMWNFGDVYDTTTSYLKNPIHNYSESGNFCARLIVQNIYYCFDTTIHCIEIDPEFTFFIPNAFSPGASNNINDYFGGDGTNISKYDMWIFDRWGNMIFHTSDLEKKWNGHANDGKEIAQRDVYVYLVELLDFQGNGHKYRGTVTLVR